jgi:hypothetical protein
VLSALHPKSQITNPKFQIISKFQFRMTKQILFRIWVIGIYLRSGLPARSRSGEGRCLGFGASI